MSSQASLNDIPPSEKNPLLSADDALDTLQCRLPLRVWTSPTGLAGYEISRIHPRAILAAPWGTSSLDEIEIYYRTLARLLDESEGEPTILILDYGRIVNTGPEPRKLFARTIGNLRSPLGGIVFVSLSPVLRLLVRMGRRFGHYRCPVRICGTREEGVRAAREIAASNEKGTKGPVPFSGHYRSTFFSRFFLRRQIVELKSLLADFPWDSHIPVSNPLPKEHPFHDLFNMWRTVKLDIDQMDQESRNCQEELGDTLKSLAESEQKHRAIFLASGSAIIVFDQERKIRMANPAALELIGEFTPLQLEEGVDWLDLVSPEDRPQLLEYHERRLRDSRQPSRYCCRFIDLKGCEHIVEVRIEIIVGTHLRVVSLIDLTDQRRLEAEKNSLEERLERVTKELELERQGSRAPLHAPEGLDTGRSLDMPGGLGSASSAFARQAILNASESDSTTLRVLVVEEDLPLSGVLRDYLEAVGYDVLCADSGSVAQELLATKSVNVVLMDIQMHEMDGLETLRKLRGTTDFRHLPVIVLTGLALDSDIQRCMEAGADLHMSKPFLMEELVRNIQRVHRERRMKTRSE